MTKNITKYLGSILVLGLFMALAPTRAVAVNLLELQLAQATELKMSDRVASNNSLCANFHYVGSSTEAVISVGATATTFYAPANVADSGVGAAADGVLTYALTSLDTMGELCDYVNGLSDYECTLKACKRDDAPVIMRDQTMSSGTSDLKTAGGFSIKFDTGSTSGDQLSAVYYETIGITPASGKRVILKTCTANINVIGTLTVYGKLKKFEGSTDGVTRDDTTSVWAAITADDTDKVIPGALTSPIIEWMEFAKDAHVVIRGATPDVDNSEQAAANMLECSWIER